MFSIGCHAHSGILLERSAVGILEIHDYYPPEAESLDFESALPDFSPPLFPAPPEFKLPICGGPYIALPIED